MRVGFICSAALLLFATAALTADVSIEQTTTIDQNGRQVVVPVIRNDSAVAQRVRIHSGSIEWSDGVVIPPGAKATLTLDGTPLRGKQYELEPESEPVR